MGYTIYFPENLADLKFSVVHAVVIVIIIFLILLVFGVSQYKLFKVKKTPE